MVVESGDDDAQVIGLFVVPIELLEEVDLCARGRFDLVKTL